MSSLVIFLGRVPSMEFSSDSGRLYREFSPSAFIPGVAGETSPSTSNRFFSSSPDSPDTFTFGPFGPSAFFSSDPSSEPLIAPMPRV